MTTHEPKAGDPLQDTQLRIALVLNGGVSLAIRMGGVTHELDLLRRASHAAVGRMGRLVWGRWISTMAERDPRSGALSGAG